MTCREVENKRLWNMINETPDLKLVIKNEPILGARKLMDGTREQVLLDNLSRNKKHGALRTL